MRSFSIGACVVHHVSSRREAHLRSVSTHRCAWRSAALKASFFRLPDLSPEVGATWRSGPHEQLEWGFGCCLIIFSSQTEGLSSILVGEIGIGSGWNLKGGHLLLEGSSGQIWPGFNWWEAQSSPHGEFLLGRCDSGCSLKRRCNCGLKEWIVRSWDVFDSKNWRQREI